MNGNQLLGFTKTDGGMGICEEICLGVDQLLVTSPVTRVNFPH